MELHTDGDRGGSRRLPGLAVAGMASVGAGAVHAAAAGIHAEHPQLARLFVVMAAAQLGLGLWALLRPSRTSAWGVVLLNAVAVGAWLVTRSTGISWIDGLETREAAQFADTACALMGATAVGAGLAAGLVGWRPATPGRVVMPALAVAALALPAMWSGSTHVHEHSEGDHEHTESTEHAHDDTATVDTHAHETDDTHPHDTAPDSTDGHTHEPPAAAWPRPWNPATDSIDFSDVEGVTQDQADRAETLVRQSLADLPHWADTEVAIAEGYQSIGDAASGSEHYINYAYVNDDKFLDPRYPESLVYTVKGDERILAGAMYIAKAMPTDDPTLVDFAGPLMTWHNHGDLCWDIVNGKPAVVGTTRLTGTCERGINVGGENPMVHVWIVPHQCGVFAALEGVGMGQTAVSEDERVDLCQEGHDHGGGDTTTSTGAPFDPTKPIDLGGTPGVTPEQQAAAENLVAINLIRLPQWSDYRVAEAAGFHSIGDGGTGHEHFVNWEWINDDVWLNPDFPESLVYEPQPDGSRKLVSAMYMLPTSVSLDEVPNIGGALMQWHIHDNLCFTADPVAPRVAGITSSGGTCNPPLVRHDPSPMIHVWIVPTPCGPFAALEGIGAGQIKEGETRLCDALHGSH